MDAPAVAPAQGPATTPQPQPGNGADQNPNVAREIKSARYQEPQKKTAIETVKDESAKEKQIALPTDEAKAKAEEKRKEKIRLQWKAKIDGAEEDVDLDEDTIKRDYQKWRGSDKRFEEAKKIYEDANKKDREVTELLQLMRTRPDLVLQQLGLNPDELAEQRLIEKMKYEMLSPDARRAFEAEQKLAQYDAYMAEQQRMQEANVTQQEYQKATQSIQAMILEGLKSGALANTPDAIARVATRMLAGDEQRNPIAPEDAVKGAKQAALQEFQHYTRQMDGKELASWLGEENLKKVREFDLGRIRQTAPKPTVIRDAQAPNNKRSWMTEREFDRYLDNLKKKS